MAKEIITSRQMVESVKANLIDVPYFDSLDYFSANGDIDILCDDFEIFSKTSYGGSEGIYADIYIHGDFGHSGINDFCICTFKTLGESENDFRQMNSLAAEFVIQTRKYVRENSELLYRRGYKVNAYTEEGKKCLTLYAHSLTQAHKVLEKYSNNKIKSASIIDCVTLDTVETITV